MSCWFVQGNFFALLPCAFSREAHASNNMCGLNCNVGQHVQIEENTYFRKKKTKLFFDIPMTVYRDIFL